MKKRSAPGIARSSFLWLAVALAGVGLAPGFAGDARSPVVVTGLLEVEIEDHFEAGWSRRVHLLKEADTGRVYKLEF